MKRYEWAFVLCVVAMGCSDQPVAPPQDTPPMAITPQGLKIVGYRPSVARHVDLFARLLASGLSEAQARLALHDALRLSPFTEHKVLLTDFLASVEGEVVVLAMASAGGIAREEVLARAAELPPIDLYVPYREHRLAWEPDQRVAVVALVDNFSPLVAHAAGGVAVSVDRASRSAASPMPVVMLGPHETTTRRPHVGTMRVGRNASRQLTIEDPFEIGVAGLQCLPEDCGGGGGGGGGGGPPPNRLWLDSMIVRGVCDNGFCGEGNEFETHSVNSSGSGGYVIRCTSVPSTGGIDVQNWPWCNGDVVHETSPSEVSWVDVWVDETDGWPNGDDEFRAAGAGGLPGAARVTNVGGGINYSFFWHWDGGNWACGSLAGFPACDPQLTLRMQWP